MKWYRPPSYYAARGWRGTRALDGGGALMNQGVHTVDLLLWLFGPVRRVFAKVATQLHAIEVEDTAVAVLGVRERRARDARGGDVGVSRLRRRIELTGIERHASGSTATTLRRDRSADARDDEQPTAPVGGRRPSAASPVVSDASAHTRVIADFIGASRRTAAAGLRRTRGTAQRRR